MQNTFSYRIPQRQLPLTHSAETGGEYFAFRCKNGFDWSPPFMWPTFFLVVG